LRFYPQGTPPTSNADRYLPGERPAEQFFRLPDPADFRLRQRPFETLPPAPIQPVPQPLPQPPEVPPNGLRR
jgi:hypothetical protein